jgi:FkbM family methyltransferase
VRPDDLIGGSIVRTGVYDLCVSEALTRLIDPGDLVVDVGANVGYMTNLSAFRVGATGRVVAVEPHPEIYEELKANVALLSASRSRGRIDTMRTAVSDVSGEAFIVDSRGFAGNRGSAQLHVGEDSPPDGLPRHRVSVRTLDDILATASSVGVLKRSTWKSTSFRCFAERFASCPEAGSRCGIRGSPKSSHAGNKLPREERVSDLQVASEVPWPTGGATG